MAEFRLDPSDPPRFSTAERERLAAITTAEVEANAEADADNPPLTAEEQARMAGPRLVRAARAATGLTQPAFARAFRINVSRLRDMEQGRYRLDSAMVAYLTVIQRDPDVVRKALSGR